MIEGRRPPSQPALAIVHKSRFPYTLMQVCVERRRYRKELSASPNQLQHVYQRSATSYFIRTQPRSSPNRSLRLPHPSFKKRTRTHILHSASMEPRQAGSIEVRQSRSELAIVHKGRLTYTLMQVCGERRWYRKELSASPNQLQHVYQRSATPHFIRGR